VDVAADSLVEAACHDATSTVVYEEGDARALAHADGAFDVACALDFLEHIEEPGRVVAEAARVLRPGGLFFFATFDRNPLAWLVVVKGVELFVANTPHDLHVLRLFIKPSELRAMCRAARLEPVEIRGSRPRIDLAFLRLLRTRTVPPELRFTFTRS